MKQISILDSTLRDGSQGEGISYSVQDKINIVKALDELGVTYIEAGNPGSNPKDMEFFADIHSAEAGKPFYVLLMNFSDEWTGVDTLADATEQDMVELKESFYETLELDDGDITFEDGKTAEGTPILIAKGVDGCFASVYTIYMSHEIEVVIYPGEE